MKTSVTETFTFEAAHRIDGLGKENGTIHGHSHIVRVTISGTPIDQWLIPQDEFRNRVNPIIKQLDHSYLNEHLKSTTAEGIAMHIFLKLTEMDKMRFPNHITLESVEVSKVGMSAKVSK